MNRGFSLSLIHLLIALGPLLSAYAAEPICTNPAVFHCEDFEAGSLRFYTGSGWSLTMSGVFDGRNALNMDYGTNAGSGFNDNYIPTISGGRVSSVSDFHMRWYEKFSSGWTWSPGATKAWVLFPNGNSFYIDPLNDNGGGRIGRRDSAAWDGTPNGDTSHYPTFPQNVGQFDWNAHIGQWIMVEVHIKLNSFNNDGSAKSDGVFQEWTSVGGAPPTLVSQYSNVVYRIANDPIHYLRLSGYWNCTSCAHPQMNRYLDNIVFANGDFMIGRLNDPSPGPQPNSPPSAPTNLRTQ